MQTVSRLTMTSDGAPPRHRLSFLLTTGAAAAILFVLYMRLAVTRDPNSDNASILLEAESFLRGNLLLQGWHLSAAAYVLDIPLYALGILAHGGIDPILMHIVPVLIVVVMVLLAVWLAGGGPARDHPTCARVVTFLLAGLPSAILCHDYFFGPNHTTTLGVLLAALLLVDTPDRFLSRRAFPAGFALLLALAQFNDAMALWVTALPILVVCGARAIMKRGVNSRLELWLLGSTFLSVLLAHGALSAVSLAGGFALPGIELAFTSIDRLGHNLHLALSAILGMSGADFFGRTLDCETGLVLLHLPGVALVIFSLRRVLTCWREYTMSEDLVSPILGVSMIFNLLAYVLSTVPGEGGTNRYLLPFTVFGAVLAGRVGTCAILRPLKVSPVDDRSGFQRAAAWAPARPWHVATTLGLAGFVYLASFIPVLGHPVVKPSKSDLSHWLMARGLRDGYGFFWSASIVTVVSQGTVRVRPLCATPRGVAPLSYSAQKSWYDVRAGSPANFVVLDQFTPFGVNRSIVEATFGAPTEVHRVGECSVLVWDKDISGLLIR